VAGWGRWRCDAVYPSRRSKPHRPGAPTARHGARLTADAGAVRHRRRREGSLAVDRRLCVQKGRLKGKSIGGDAEQTYKHRARDAGDLADLRH